MSHHHLKIMQVKTCTGINEAEPLKRPRKKKFLNNVRDAILSAPDWMVYSNECEGGDFIEKFSVMLWYAVVMHKGQGHKKTMVKETDSLLDKWENLIVGLATSHSKDDRDKHEHDIDEALTPILSAPVKQIREMFRQLVERLKANEKVPFYCWRSIEVWYEKTVLPAKAEKIIKLKTKLATEIAEMVEEDVRADIGEAIIGALMWRDEKSLKEMKALLVEPPAEVAQIKPETKVQRKTVGRQSCIFLNVKRGDVEKSIML